MAGWLEKYEKGSHIKKKKYRSSAPRVSYTEPSNMASGPFTQRGITFADGGKISKKTQREINKRLPVFSGEYPVVPKSDLILRDEIMFPIDESGLPIPGDWVDKNIYLKDLPPAQWLEDTYRKQLSMPSYSFPMFMQEGGSVTYGTPQNGLMYTSPITIDNPCGPGMVMAKDQNGNDICVNPEYHMQQTQSRADERLSRLNPAQASGEDPNRGPMASWNPEIDGPYPMISGYGESLESYSETDCPTCDNNKKSRKERRMERKKPMREINLPNIDINFPRLGIGRFMQNTWDSLKDCVRGSDGIMRCPKFEDGGPTTEVLLVNSQTGVPVKTLPEIEITAERPDTYNNYITNKYKDAGLGSVLFGMPLDYVFGYPQAAATKLMTGKYQLPSEAMGIENPVGAIATDAVLDPANLVGAGVLTKDAALARLAASKESGLLSNAYKYNPWAFKPNPEAYYRGIGEAGLQDALETNILRANATGKNLTNNRTYTTPFFDKGRVELANALGKGKIAEVVDVPMKEFSPNHMGVAPYNINTGEFLKNIPIDNNVKLLQKDWLRGYKEVPKQEAGGMISGTTGMYDVYGDGDKVNLNLPSREMPVRQKGLGFNNYLRVIPNMGGDGTPALVGGVNPMYHENNFSVGPYVTGYADLQGMGMTDYGIRGNYNVNNRFSIGADMNRNRINAGLQYKFEDGGPTGTDPLKKKYDLVQEQINTLIKSDSKKGQGMTPAQAKDYLMSNTIAQLAETYPAINCPGPNCNKAASVADYLINPDIAPKPVAGGDTWRDMIHGNTGYGSTSDDLYKNLVPGSHLQQQIFKTDPDTPGSASAWRSSHNMFIWDVKDLGDGKKRISTVQNPGTSNKQILKEYDVDKDGRVYYTEGGLAIDKNQSIRPVLIYPKNEAWSSPELNQLIKQREEIKSEILKIDPNAFDPKQTKRWDTDYQSGIFVPNYATSAYGPYVTNYKGNKNINLSESRIPEILDQVNSPEYKKKIMSEYNITNDEYNSIVKTMMGQYMMESQGGTDWQSGSKVPEHKGLAKFVTAFGKDLSEKSIGPFQINYSQLGEKTKTVIPKQGTSNKSRQEFINFMYDPLTSSDVAVRFLAENIPQLRYSAKEGERENLTRENYLGKLPYLLNQQGWLKRSDKESRKKKGSILGEGTNRYVEGVNYYADQLVDYIPLSNDTFITNPPEVVGEKIIKAPKQLYNIFPSYRNGGWLDSYGKGGMIKRADGSYSRRGLWDNIRANRGSGKKPTKEMLKQERKIRAAEKKETGGYINKTNNNWLDNL